MNLIEIVNSYKNIQDIIEKIDRVTKKDEKIKLYENFFFHIKDECSQIIKIYKITSNSDRFLFRGIKNNKNNRILVLNIKEDRKPRDTPHDIHNFFDETIEKLGFDTNRSNSIFCIPKLSDAKFYGKPYIVFPNNGFKYLWGKNIKDLYVLLLKINHREIKKIYNQNKLSILIKNKLYYAENYQKLKDFYENLVTLLMKILDKVFGKKYVEKREEYLKEKNFKYVENPTRKDIERLLYNFDNFFNSHTYEQNFMDIVNKHLKRDEGKIYYEDEMYDIIKKEYTDKNIIDAILNYDNEIMISNPTNKKYYAINANDKNIIKNIIEKI